MKITNDENFKLKCENNVALTKILFGYATEYMGEYSKTIDTLYPKDRYNLKKFLKTITGKNKIVFSDIGVRVEQKLDGTYSFDYDDNFEKNIDVVIDYIIKIIKFNDKCLEASEYSKTYQYAVIANRNFIQTLN